MLTVFQFISSKYVKIILPFEWGVAIMLRDCLLFSCPWPFITNADILRYGRSFPQSRFKPRPLALTPCQVIIVVDSFWTWPRSCLILKKLANNKHEIPCEIEGNCHRNVRFVMWGVWERSQSYFKYSHEVTLENPTRHERSMWKCVRLPMEIPLKAIALTK